MKKLIILLSIFSFVLTHCVAQTRIQLGEIKTKNAIYSIKKSNIDFGKEHSYFVFGSKNKYEHTGIPKPTNKNALHVYRKDFHVNEDKIKEIIYDVLGSQITALHNNSESISVFFVFETNGELTDAYYTLKENTILTTQEIDNIDNRLRKEIKATFTGKNYLDYKAVDYPYLKPIVF